MKQSTKQSFEFGVPNNVMTRNKAQYTDRNVRTRSPFNQAKSFQSVTTVKSANKPMDDKHMKLVQGNTSKFMDISQRREILSKNDSKFTTKNLDEKKILQNEMQRLKAENAMLTNELSEFKSELIQVKHRMQTTLGEKQCLEKYIGQLEMKQMELMNNGHSFQEILKQKLEIDVQVLQTAKAELENRITNLEENKAKDTINFNNLESDKLNLQTQAESLQKSLQVSEEKVKQLELEFETYKKSMEDTLKVKDDEITELKDRGNLTEDTKILMEKKEILKKERDKLKEETAQLCKVCAEMKTRMEHAESRSVAVERLYSNMKKSLKDERLEKQRLIVECNTLRMEINTLQEQSSLKIAQLQEAVKNKTMMTYKDLRSTSSQSLDDSVVTGALNVADYATSNCSDTPMQTEMEDQKVKDLADVLSKKQIKINELMMENTELKNLLEQVTNKKKQAVEKKETVVEAQNKPAHDTKSFSNNLMDVQKFVENNKVIFYLITISVHLWFISWLLKKSPLDFVDILDKTF